MRQEFRDVRMDAMLEQQEHLRIRISIIENNPQSRAGSLADVESELAELEQDIAYHRPLRR